MLNQSKAEAIRRLIRDYAKGAFNEHDARGLQRFTSIATPDNVAVSAVRP